MSSPASTSVRHALVAGFLTVVILLAAPSARAQSSTQQTGRPQPAPKVAAPQGPTPTTATPQTSGTKASEPQASAPKTAGAQPTGPKSQAPKGPVKRKPLPPQTSRAWKGRGFVVVSGGAQLVAPGYTSTATFTVHAEDATLEARSSVRIGPAFSVRGGKRVWKNLAIGADLGVAATTQRLAVTGSLPHPFMFNQFRKVEGTASGLARIETMVAVEGSWLVAVRRRVDMFVFAGPAYFNVTQDMATGIRFTEVYPYDTATFTGVESTSVRAGAVGVTAGADIAYLVTRRLGIGGELRYSYASARLTPAGQSATVGLGGLQLCVSARVLF